MADNPVNWFEIYVQDMEKARVFYEGVLQVKLERLENPGLEMWSFPQNSHAHGSGGALVRYPDKAPGINSTIVYFSCEDCAVESARAEEFGGRLEREKMSIGQYGYIALALDPDGNMIGLHSTR